MNGLFNPFGPVRIDKHLEKFFVRAAVRGDIGTFVFERASEIFFAPKFSATHFYQQHRRWDRETGEAPGERVRKIICSSDPYEGTYRIALTNTGFASTFFDGDAHRLELLSQAECLDFQSRIRNRAMRLWSLPQDREVKQIVELPTAAMARSGFLAFTSLKYSTPSKPRAVVIASTRGAPATEYLVSEFREISAGVTAFAFSDGHSVWCSRQGEDVQIKVDGLNARILPHSEIADLIRQGRIPGVPSYPSELVRPVEYSELVR